MPRCSRSALSSAHRSSDIGVSNVSRCTVCPRARKALEVCHDLAVHERIVERQVADVKAAQRVRHRTFEGRADGSVRQTPAPLAIRQCPRLPVARGATLRRCRGLRSGPLRGLRDAAPRQPAAASSAEAHDDSAYYHEANLQIPESGGEAGLEEVRERSSPTAARELARRGLRRGCAHARRAEPRLERGRHGGRDGAAEAVGPRGSTFMSASFRNSAPGRQLRRGLAGGGRRARRGPASSGGRRRPSAPPRRSDVRDHAARRGNLRSPAASRWSAVAPPEHLQLFSVAGLRATFRQAGLRPRRIRTQAVNPHELLGALRRRTGATGKSGSRAAMR